MAGHYASDGSTNVTIVGGSSSGAEYTEGDTDASITGTVALMEVAANTVQPIQGTVADGLLVNLGSNNDVTVTGTVTANLSATDNAVLDDIALDTEAIKTAVEILDNAVSGNELQVDIVSGVLTTVSTVTAVTTVGTITNPVAVTQSGTWDEVGINDSGNSITVDNGGTFAVQAAQSGTWTVQHATSGIGHGVTTVTTAGTDVALAGSTAAKWVTIQAQTDNTSKIAVGATGVDATIATGNGIILNPGDVINLPVDNLADVFIDSLVNGEGVRYTYGT